ncbi:hypothetical protein RBSWK_00136 [Rhodopirellula baltica SWK14]|uniref:Uncharacterized protein n=1 Tax=Rhodopirellula baltica SWK14 TaxID=993516 RepID=L7CPL7_RHOBT|nr:hypothetical protein RBSWK_00136 [Rhodopirellula baltica SWK14]
MPGCFLDQWFCRSAGAAEGLGNPELVSIAVCVLGLVLRGADGSRVFVF